METEEIEEKVKKLLSEYRYYHSKCVKKRCAELAKIYGVNIEKAEKVGIAHDIAKEMSEEEKFEYIKKHKLYVDYIEIANTALLHAKIGADIAKNEFDFSSDMVEAIFYHTTAGENMGILSKILYVADATGEDRDWEDLNLVREMSETNLDKAILYIINLNLEKNIKKEKMIHPNSILARNAILKAMESIKI